MATQAEVIALLNTAAEKQTKTIGEIATLQGTVTDLNEKVAELNQIIAGMGTDASPELLAAAQRVSDLATQVDDQIPDVLPVPTPEPAP